MRESDEPRIWNGRGVLQLAFLRCARVNCSQLCDELIDVDFRMKPLLVFEVLTNAYLGDYRLHVLFVWRLCCFQIPFVANCSSKEVLCAETQSLCVRFLGTVWLDRKRKTSAAR